MKQLSRFGEGAVHRARIFAGLFALLFGMLCVGSILDQFNIFTSPDGRHLMMRFIKLKVDNAVTAQLGLMSAIGLAIFVVGTLLLRWIVSRQR
jgi:hypothetical protein